MTKVQPYEQELLASLKKGEWRPVKNQKKEHERCGELAAEALRKSRRGRGKSLAPVSQNRSVLGTP